MNSKKTFLIGCVIFLIMLFTYTHYSSQPIRSTEILPIDNEAVARFLETSTFEQPVLKESVYGKPSFDEDDLVYYHTIDEIAPGKISYSETSIISKRNAKEEQYHDLIKLTIHGNDLNTPYHVSFRQFFNGNEPDEFFLVVENLLSGKITLKDLSGVYDFSVYTSGNDQHDPEFERSLAPYVIADNSLFLVINKKDVLAVEFDFSKDDTTKIYSLKSDFWEQFDELKSGFKKIYAENNMSLALEMADKNVYYYYPFTNTLMNKKSITQNHPFYAKTQKEKVVFEKSINSKEKGYFNAIYRAKQEFNDYVTIVNSIYDKELITANPKYTLVSSNDKYALLLQYNEDVNDNNKYTLLRFNLDKKIIDWKKNINYIPRIALFKKGFVVYPKFRNSEDTKRLFILNEHEEITF